MIFKFRAADVGVVHTDRPLFALTPHEIDFSKPVVVNGSITFVMNPQAWVDLDRVLMRPWRYSMQRRRHVMRRTRRRVQR